MGAGIAQVAAVAGHRVMLFDAAPGAAERAIAGIRERVKALVTKGKLDVEPEDLALSAATTFAELAPAKVVVEAIVEDLGVKQRLFADIEAIVPADCVLASNTSSLSPTALASRLEHPERVVGLHFFNPVPLMPLVEVVRAVSTSRDVFERTVTFARRLGKEPITARDRSGFVVNRLLVPYLLDAVRALEQGVGSAPDIDRGMQLGCGHPMGPLTLADFVGLDTLVRIAEIMFDEYREPRFAPPPLLRRMVAAGLHGRKSGRGFYDYASDPPHPLDLAL
jgi:3-hydroxybutyryl-CoA dehydrogenase